MNKKFRPYYQKTNIPYLLISCILSIFLVVGTTLAFFYADDFATNSTTMSGKVVIKAVGAGDAYESIEDTSTSNLIITLQDNYPVFIPNMKINLNANCKVYMSTTKPLLRARLELLLIDMSTGEIDKEAFIDDIYGQFVDNILDNSKWIKYKVNGEAEEYFYYIGTTQQSADEGDYGNYLLEEIDVSTEDKIIHFINEPIKFPSYVTSEYSGLGVQIKITFQAIQNYIPDDDGHKLENTIDNAQKIFKTFNKDSGSGESGSTGSSD